MPMPAPAVMAAAKPAAASGSSFLTGPIGYGVGAAAGQIAGQALGSKSVNFRGKYARNKLEHDKKIWAAQQAHHLSTIRPNQRELMKSMDDSGLHRLAALGMTPGQGQTSSSNQPMIPGQSPDFGSAIGTGINTAIQLQQGSNQKALAGLQVEEQSLRNDYLRTQIANSKMALLKGLANSSQDVGISLNEAKKPHSGKIVVGQQPPIPHTTDTSGYSLFGGDSIQQKPGVIRGQALEDAVGELMAAVFGPFQFAQDVGYTGDRWLERNYRKRKSNPYKSMGKTGFTKQ